MPLALLVLASLAAVLAISHQSSLRGQEHRQYVEQSLFARLQAALQEQQAIQQALVSTPHSLAADQPLLRRADQAVAGTVSALQSASAATGGQNRFQLTILPQLSADYQQSAGDVMKLLTTGKIASARGLYSRLVAPGYAQLTALVATGAAQQQRSLHEATNAASRGDLLGYGAAALVIVLVLVQLVLARAGVGLADGDSAAPRGRRNEPPPIATDPGELEKLEERVKELGEQDLLTGMANRQALLNELDRQLRYARRYGRGGAVLTLNLDRFQKVNNTYGHAIGDLMLKAVSEVLMARTRSTDFVARLDGDEFAVLLPEATENDALNLARDLRWLLCERRVGAPIMASMGIAEFTGTEELTADDLLVAASIALFESKEHGGDQVRVYTGQSSNALTWVQRIRAALDEDRFVLYGQPIADLRSGMITHHELFLRMLSEDGDIIPPAAFLPTAERFGLVREIDRWVTTASLRLAIEGEGVAINLSGYSIGDQQIVAAVRAAIDEGLDASKVIFDVDEHAAITNFAAARQFAGLLKGLGCSLALDDFGTGFGSFTYLKHMPARYVKIDMSFVTDIASSETDHHVVRSIVNVAHCLDKLTVAERVQDAETLAILKAIGVDYVQGFHIGAPKRLSPPTAFERQLRMSKAATDARVAVAGAMADGSAAAAGVER